MATYALLVLVAGVMAISAASWTFAIGKYLAGQRGPLSRETASRAPSQWGVIDLLLNVFVYVLLTVLAGAAVRMLQQPAIEAATAAAPESAPTPLLFLAIGIAQVLSVLLGTVLLRYRAGSAGVKALWSFREFRSDLILALYAFGLVIVPVFLIQAGLTQVIKYEHPAITPFRESKDWVFFAGAAFSAVISAPLGEEYFFRGLFQGFLERFAVLGARSWEDLFAPKSSGHFAVRVESTAEIAPAVSAPEMAANPFAFDSQVSELRAVEVMPHWPLWVVSGIFAMMHMSQGPAPVPLFVFSVAMGYAYRHTGRILPSLIMHFMLNGFSMTMLALSTFMPQTP